MPGFDLTGGAQAPVEEVWKLLFDPTRFPEWWVGTETVQTGGAGEYTIWLSGYPDFPIPQQLRSDRMSGRVSVSCQVSDIDFHWQLSESGAATVISVQVDVPAAQAHRLDGQRAAISASLSNLAAIAERAARPR